MKINRYKSNSETSYALGATLVFELIKTSPNLLKRVFISPNLDKNSSDIQEILAFCESNKIETIESEKPFNILSPKGNTFVIAEFKKQNQNLNPSEDHVVLVNPSDAGNIGTIIRSAVGFGYKNLAIVSPAVDVYNPKAIRASMGAVFHINICYFNCFDEYMKNFPDHHRFAFMLRNATDFSKTEIASPYSLIFGNESSGLPDNFADFCTSVKIPQSENIDSLSLPMAATLAMYVHRKI
jgi:TrmH family RNA methyltransferase